LKNINSGVWVTVKFFLKKILKTMLPGQLVKETGLSKNTNRCYEKHGLIKVNNKERRDNNYKKYSNEILTKLLTVKRLKSFGFTFNEIAD
jgi:DNA-binding transcriptional MerR regulator